MDLTDDKKDPMEQLKEFAHTLECMARDAETILRVLAAVRDAKWPHGLRR